MGPEQPDLLRGSPAWSGGDGTERSTGMRGAALPAVWLWSTPGKWDRVCEALDGRGGQAVCFVT